VTGIRSGSVTIRATELISGKNGSVSIQVK
jgi:hypothetical protein